MKSIELTRYQPFTLPESIFYHATDGRAATQPTHVTLCAETEGLRIDFRCEQNPFVGANTLTRHNDDLYNQEVFEVFIAPQAEHPTHYLEVELNPNNALWVGHIENMSLGEGGENKLTLVPYEAANIQHHVEIDGDTWQGQLFIPWTLVGEAADTYRINFYRIVAEQQPPANIDWIGTPETCAYLCWSATMSGEQPAFHRPKKFGLLQIK